MVSIMKTKQGAAGVVIFDQDDNGWVRATFRDGGYVKDQSIEAPLLLEILNELRRLNAR